jgi:hypothetical protein
VPPTNYGERVDKQSDDVTTDSLKDMAYHYEAYWDLPVGSQLKSLLLFFDGIALTVPDSMRDAPILADPVLAQPLAEQGLLVQLSPETMMDVHAAETITETLDEMLSKGHFDGLDRHHQFELMVPTRAGWEASPYLVGSLFTKLMSSGLALLGDKAGVRLHPVVREFILVMVPQLLREPAEREGYALHPATSRSAQVQALIDLLGQSPMPTAGHVVEADLQQVTLDLSSIPLDEVLDFRRAHGAAYRAYARDLRRFVREMSVLGPKGRDQAIADRRAELVDIADNLLQTSRKAWKRPTLALTLGIAGAAVSLASGNPIPAGIAFASALVGFKRQADPGSAYSYLFKARDTLSSRSG